MIKIQNISGLYKITSSQHVDAKLDKVWDYYSRPANLESITPKSLSFKILNNPIEEMKEGDIIKFKMKLLPLINISWVTEIKSLKPLKYFIDEQKIGPYKLWHHRHSFEANRFGTTITDEIHFALPLKFISNILYTLFIKKKLKEIFEYRNKRIINLL